MTAFRVWAPVAGRAEVEVAGRRYPMSREAAPPSRDWPGWWSAEVPAAVTGVGTEAPGVGTDYGFRLDDGELLPDPRSLRQPFGIRGPSRTYDHSAFGWTDRRWRGGPLHGSVIY